MGIEWAFVGPDGLPGSESKLDVHAPDDARWLWREQSHNMQKNMLWGNRSKTTNKIHVDLFFCRRLLSTHLHAYVYERDQLTLKRRKEELHQ